MSDNYEMAAIISDALAIPKLGEKALDSLRVADRLAAAGYVKPRMITTSEELDALTEGTTIVDMAERLTLEETSFGCLEWVDRHGNACWVELPATVLPEPKSA
jgi:hypothetical protein